MFSKLFSGNYCDICLLLTGFNRWRPVTLQTGGDGESVAGIFKSKTRVCSWVFKCVHTNHLIVSLSSEPNRRQHSERACSLNRRQTRLWIDSQRVPEAGPSGENRGGQEAVRGGGEMHHHFLYTLLSLNVLPLNSDLMSWCIKLLA